MGIRWRSVPPRRLAPPLSCPKQPFLTPSRTSGAPAARRADLGRAHQPPDGWSRHSVAVRATSLAGPPTQTAKAAHWTSHCPSLFATLLARSLRFWGARDALGFWMAFANAAVFSTCLMLEVPKLSPACISPA